ncbi:MAG: radical SAM protein [Planctomycetota bacterium]
MRDGRPEVRMSLRDYTYLGTTESLCPRCRRLVPAKIVARDGRVYFRKRCPEHGAFDDFVWSDVTSFDRHEHSQPARMPKFTGADSAKGCPYDCGLCPEHEQHTCIGLVEVTSSCNLRCPMCFAESGPGGTHIEFDTFVKMVDRFVAAEGEADVLQISGGEPTVHPRILDMIRHAVAQPVKAVMLNTNGIRLAKDEEFVAALASFKEKFEVYLQFDGFTSEVYGRLRGAELVETKLMALENLARHGIRTTLVCTVEHGTNLDQLGKVLRFGLEREHVRGVSYQLATYCGRHLDPKDLERRATMPDVVKRLVEQTAGLLEERDFFPLPCAHPNCHTMGYLYRGGSEPVPLSRLIDVEKHMDLLANSVVYTPQRARDLVSTYLDRAAGGGCCGPGTSCGPSEPAFEEFVAKALAEQIDGGQVFRITLTAFLDAYNFDVRQLMKCCIAHILPTGHIVPFCAYNTLYRDGFLSLPPLAR